MSKAITHIGNFKVCRYADTVDVMLFKGPEGVNVSLVDGTFNSGNFETLPEALKAFHEKYNEHAKRLGWKLIPDD